MKNLDKIYSEIVKKRDERLNKSKETGDYEFCVAHGLTEAIRCFPDICERGDFCIKCKDDCVYAGKKQKLQWSRDNE